MKTGTHWQRIAERLADAGWSWSHRTRTDTRRQSLHLADARNDDVGQVHIAIAKSIAPAFIALERSTKANNH